ncbi:hypothetical protein AGMMS50239_24660 [Bacteroidia bacterium]|nr:hypothetical protein AGMMS50239_24660 [Bacteroidia bacterium]
MRCLINIGIILCASILFCACVKELPFDSKESEVAVVNCLLTNDSIQQLSLTQSVKITDPYLFKEIRDAEISLSTGGEIVGYFERESYGNWQLKYTPVNGNVYRLLVKLPDGKELTASTTMPPAIGIEPLINRDRYPTRNFNQTTADYPCWIYVLRDNDLPPDLMNPHPSAKAILANNLGADHPMIDRFNKHDNMSDIEMEVSMPFYDFYLRIQPSSGMAENVSFGIQAAYSYYSYIYFRTVSDEYDKYLKSSIQKMNIYQDADDPIHMFDESKVYSNITNGMGIFAAYNEISTFYNRNLFVVHNGKVLFYDGNIPPFF